MGFFKKMLHSNELDTNNIPKHIAIIMDGNGRWAKKRGLPRSMGHREGAQTLIKTVEACEELGVKYLTVYAFSTENWKRPKDEVDYLMDLLSEYLQKLSKDKDNNTCIKVIGDTSKLSQQLQQDILNLEESTTHKMGVQLNLAINYGGRDEIHHAVKKILSEFKEKDLSEEFIKNIDVDTFSKYLYTSDIPDPDLIIRPSGELRLSNFLLYQCAYSEFWFAKINWPDFNKEHLIKAICDFQNRNRRFGGI